MCCLGRLEDNKLVHKQLCQNANCGSNVGAWRAILANATGRCAARLCTFMRLLNAWQISP